jgi:TetR/AcrR family transcriptional repressor of nem operon
MARVRDKAASHERIVDAAAQKIRSDGADRLSVAALMEEAGLTHGGFYRHFSSRDALVDEAVAAALADGGRYTSGDDLPDDALTGIVTAYLSTTHRDHPEHGCAVTALGADVARAGDNARAAYADQVRAGIDYLTKAISQSDTANPDARREAVSTLATMVGALVMARATRDDDLSEEILNATRTTLLDQGAGGRGPAPEMDSTRE